MSLLCRLKNLVHKDLLKKEDLDRIVIIPKEQENKIIQMRDATPEEIESINKYVNKYVNSISKLTGVSFDKLEQEHCDDMVSRGVFDQVKWERDVAIEQLKELGYVLGQKIEPCEDCISRNKVLEGKEIHQSCDGVEIINGYAVPVEYIEQLPPVTPKTDVLDKIRAIVIKWQNDTWWTDNVSYECMQKIADLIAESEE